MTSHRIHQQFLALTLPIGWFLTPVVASAQATWNGNLNADWANAGNWTPGIPVSGENITIADATTNGLTADNSKNIGSLTFGTNGTRITGFTLNSQIANSITINGGIIANGVIPTTAALTMRGNFTVANGQTWTVNGSAAHATDQGIFVREVTTGATNRGSLVLGGNLTKDGTGQLLFAAIDVTGTGNLVIDSGGLKFNAGASQPLVVGGLGNITMNGSSTLAVYKNSGTMAITRSIGLNGTTSLITVGSPVDIASPITFNGTHTLSAGGTTNLTGNWNGAGTINRTSGGTLTASGLLSGFTGAFNANAGITNLSGPLGGSLSLASGATLNGEATAAGSLTLNGGTVGVNPVTPGSLGTSGDLILTGVNIISLTSNPASTAPFTVLSYGGTLTGDVNNLSLLGGNANYRTPAFSDTTLGVITLAVGSESRTWNGGGAWDINTSPNWLGGDNLFFQLDSVTFGDTGAGPVAITGVLAPSSITINSTEDYTFTAAAGSLISGSTGIAKNGSGTTVLGGANTFLGNITVAAGTLKPSGNQAFGLAPKTITVNSGATLDTNGAMTASRDYDTVIAGDGSGDGAIVNSGAGQNFGFRSATLTADATIGGSGRWDFRPITAGQAFINLDGHKLTKTGFNIIAFVDGTISSPGQIEINEGTFSFTRGIVSGSGDVSVNNGALMQLENYTSGSFSKPIVITDSTLRNVGANLAIDSTVSIIGNSIISVGTGNSFTINQPINGTGNLDKQDAGVLVLPADNGYSGSTTVTAGTIQLGNGGTTGSINAGPVDLVSTTSAIRFNRSDDFTFANVVTGFGPSGNDINPSALTKEGTNTVTLTGANTYTGSTRLAAGTIAIGSDETVFGLGTGGGSVVDLRGASIRSSDASPRTIINPISFSVNTTLGSASTGKLTFSGTVAFGGGTKAMIVNNALTEFSGVIFGTGTTTFLIKDGPGTLLFTGNNTYSQATTVNSGILQIGNGQETGSLGGGAVINNASLVVNLSGDQAINNDISGTGSLTHSGPAVTILGGNNSYTGDTIVTDGVISPSLASFDDNSTIRLSGDGTIELFHGQTDIVGKLFINSLPQAIGLWGRIGSKAALGAQFETPLLTGDGLLDVTSSGSAYDSWATAAGLTAANDAPTDNPDFDGFNNLAEFGFDSNPLSGTSSGKIVGKIATVGGSSTLTLTLPVRAAVGAFSGTTSLTATGDGVTYTIEGSDELGTWLLDIDEVTGADATAIQTGLPPLGSAEWVYRTFRSPGTVTGDPQEFMRAKVE